MSTPKKIRVTLTLVAEDDTRVTYEYTLTAESSITFAANMMREAVMDAHHTLARTREKKALERSLQYVVPAEKKD